MNEKKEPAKPAGRNAGYRLVDLWEKQGQKPKTIGEAMAEVLRHPHPAEGPDVKVQGALHAAKPVIPFPQAPFDPIPPTAHAALAMFHKERTPLFALLVIGEWPAGTVPPHEVMESLRLVSGKIKTGIKETLTGDGECASIAHLLANAFDVAGKRGRGGPLASLKAWYRKTRRLEDAIGIYRAEKGRSGSDKSAIGAVTDRLGVKRTAANTLLAPMKRAWKVPPE